MLTSFKAETCRLCYVTLCVSGDDQTGCVEKDMKLYFNLVYQNMADCNQ